MTFDARAIKLLKPSEHLTSPDFPGLRLEATDTRRSWTYRYRSPVDQRTRQIKLGSWPAMSVHAAIAAWEEARRRRDSGEDLAERAKVARSTAREEAVVAREKRSVAAYTVRDVAIDYWTGYVLRYRAKKGATEVRRIFDTMLGEIGARAAISLTRAEAFGLIDAHAARAPVQAGKLKAELAAAWDHAIDAGRLPEELPNWWRLILRRKIRSMGKRQGGELVGTAKRVLTVPEVGALINWLPNFTALIDDVLTVYLWTGARGAEIVGMLGSDVSEEEGGLFWWTVPKERTKNARHERAADLRVPLFGRARGIVLRRKARYGLGPLFPARVRGQPKPVEQKTIQTSVWLHQPYSQTRPEEPRVRLPVTHWSPHDLRRTSRTLLAAMGCPDSVAESILGHLISGVGGVYNLHSYDVERVEWLGRLSVRLEQIAEAHHAAR